jgi:hypothetical protein
MSTIAQRPSNHAPVVLWRIKDELNNDFGLFPTHDDAFMFAQSNIDAACVRFIREVH